MVRHMAYKLSLLSYLSKEFRSQRCVTHANFINEHTLSMTSEEFEQSKTN
uniref:Uncharacterized protein n=1 Tax=Anguilla anguilla TaxID=7936 RepID=A0A0E9RTB2_ANGAN